MKTVLVACDSFKGTLTSEQIADVFQDIANSNNIDVKIKKTQIADGGEGTLSAVLSSGRFKRRDCDCMNPLFKPIRASYAACGDTAVVECAEASGITLIEYKDDNALYTTTFGTGEQIAHAIENGATHVYVCLGGSATNDGGIGALAALGFDFLDKNGNKILPIGKNLINIASVNTDKTENLNGVDFTLVCDVDNPLVGDEGATRFYGKQKGAIGESAALLEKGMTNFADITQKTVGVRLHDMKSAGAAGGLAGGLIAYLGARTQSGIECVLDLIGFDDLLDGVDVVVTGEGRIDEQSLHGKAVAGVCKRAQKKGIPVYAIAGYTDMSKDMLSQFGIAHVETLLEHSSSVQDSMAHAKEKAGEAALALLKMIAEA